MARTEITAKYLPIESWFYDAVVADAVLHCLSGLLDRLEPVVAAGGTSFLEVGCGGGQFATRLIDRYPYVRVTGVDLSDEQITRARRRTARLPPAQRQRMHFDTASALDLPYPNESFDAVISVASIKHWPDRATGIGEMVRVLKGGGLLLVAEIDRGCRLSDARAFVRAVRLPAPLRSPYLWIFRTYIAGQSVDLDDARAAVAGQPLHDTVAERIPNSPFLLFCGTKTSTR